MARNERSRWRGTSAHDARNTHTTGYARLDVPDLTPGTYLFRVFATVGKIPGEPTQPTSLTIH
jgi:hypothetical protein